MSAASHVWEDSARGVSVHLSREVLFRLGMDALEAFKALPRRGLEIGGLLLGSADGAGIRVEDFYPVECEHGSGSSYRLSEADGVTFAAALQARPGTVGVYRSQTRSETLQFDEDDLALFQRYFAGREGVLLLIQPATRKAALFVSEGAGLTRVDEFPLTELSPVFTPGEENPPKVRRHELMAILLRLEAMLPPQWPRYRRWLPVGAAVLLGILAGAVVVHYRRPSIPIPSTQPARRPPAAHIDLAVRRDGTGLVVSWDRNSPLVRTASHANLHITDGKYLSNLELSNTQLSSGVLSYWPQSPDVDFRLEVVTPKATVAESARVLGGEPDVKPSPFAEAKSAAAPLPTLTSEVPPAEQADGGPSASASKEIALLPAPHKDFDGDPADGTDEASRSSVEPDRGPVRVAPASSRDAATEPAPSRHQFARASPPPVREPVQMLPLPPPRTPGSKVVVFAEPVKGNGWMSRVPLLRRLKKQPQAFVPPEPVHEERPVLTAEQQRKLTGTVPLDVKVYVTNSGKVDYAELISNTRGRHEDLATAAVYSARHWSFTPARLGDENVPGEMILHFRFEPEGENAGGR